MKTGCVVILWVSVLLLMGCATLSNQPRPEIVGVTARESFGFDYKVFVDCTVKNNGTTGTITVQANLSNGGRWKKERTLAIAEGATELVTLEFPEATLLGTGLSGYRYNCSTG